jgi:hypothetical protein
MADRVSGCTGETLSTVLLNWITNLITRIGMHDAANYITMYRAIKLCFNPQSAHIFIKLYYYSQRKIFTILIA